MITLLTGVPGSGKTAELVKLLQALSQDRPLYVAGLNGLTLPHLPVEPNKWHEEVPDGAVIAIDEVQEFWRPRGPSQQVTAAVAALEKHRHRGVDFFITTQRPNLLDSNVRGLVGRHIHIRDTGWLGRWWYEWPECSENLAWKTCSIKKKHKLPTEVFGLYKSATIHTKPVRGTSPLLKLGIMLGLAVLVLAALIWRSVGQRGAEDSPEVKTQPTMTAAVHHDTTTARGIVQSFTPRIAERPETAPAYDHLRKVSTMPRITGGYCQGEACRCFTQQFTDPGLTHDQCRAWIKSRPFDPYRVEAQASQPTPSMEKREPESPIVDGIAAAL